MGKENNKLTEIKPENTERPKPDPKLVSYTEKKLTPENIEERLNKSFKWFHSIFNVYVGQGDVDGGFAWFDEKIYCEFIFTSARVKL